MLQFFRAGGFPMFVVLAVGLAAIVLAARKSPDGAKMAAIQKRAVALRQVLLFVAAGAFTLDLAAVFTHAPEYAAGDPNTTLTALLITGCGEALSPVVLGLLLLALAVAVEALVAPSAPAPAARLL